MREIRSEIEDIEGNRALYDEANFSARAEALDFLEFSVIGRIESLLLTDGRAEGLTGLRQYAEMVKGQLEGVDENLFRRLREDIASGNTTSAELKQQFVEYAGSSPREESDGDEGTYDDLDALTNGLLLIGVAPEETKEREPEMVFYQPTPARIILELVEKADFR
jgi:hypothetical protein